MDTEHTGVEGEALDAYSRVVTGVAAGLFEPTLRRGSLLSNNVVVGMPTAMLEESHDGVERVLSGRELEILLLASRGLSNRQIATRVRLAEETVKRHLTNTYQRWG